MNDNDAAPAVPTFDALMIPTLKALMAMGGSASNQELLDKVIELEAFSEEVQNFLHTDHRQTKLNYNLAWAKTYLRKVGAVDNSQRGVWTITSTAEDVVADDIPDLVNRHYPDNPQTQGNRPTVPPPRERHPYRSHPMA